jgi:hypothetical protein
MIIAEHSAEALSALNGVMGAHACQKSSVHAGAKRKRPKPMTSCANPRMAFLARLFMLLIYYCDALGSVRCSLVADSARLHTARPKLGRR